MTDTNLGVSIRAALSKADDNQSTSIQLVDFAQRVRQHDGSLADLGLDTDTIDILLDEFATVACPSIIRRWIGVLLLAVAEIEPLHLASITQIRQHTLGDIVFSHTTEDVRLLAGAIIRSVAADGTPIDTFWSPTAEKALVDKFPENGDSQWIEQFQESLDVLAMDTMSDADIYWAVYATIDQNTIRPNGGRIVVFAEHDCLKLVTPPTPGPPRFVDLSYKSINSTQVALMPVKSHGRSSNQPVLVLKSDRTNPMTVSIDARARQVNQIEIWFKDLESAKEISSIITDSHSSTESAAKTDPSRRPLMTGAVMKVAKSSHPVKFSQDNSSPPLQIAPAVNKAKALNKASRHSTGGMIQSKKIVAKMQDERGRSSPHKMPSTVSKAIKSTMSSLKIGPRNSVGTSAVVAQKSRAIASGKSRRHDPNDQTRDKKTQGHSLSTGNVSPVPENANLSENSLALPVKAGHKTLHSRSPAHLDFNSTDNPRESKDDSLADDEGYNILQESPFIRGEPVQSIVVDDATSGTDLQNTKAIHTSKNEQATKVPEIRSNPAIQPHKPLQDQAIGKPTLISFTKDGPVNQGIPRLMAEDVHIDYNIAGSTKEDETVLPSVSSAQKRSGSPIQSSHNKQARLSGSNIEGLSTVDVDFVMREPLPYTPSRPTGSQLSQYVDQNGSPYPRNKCLPVGKMPPPKNNLSTVEGAEVVMLQTATGPQANTTQQPLRLMKGVEPHGKIVLVNDNSERAHDRSAVESLEDTISDLIERIEPGNVVITADDSRYSDQAERIPSVVTESNKETVAAAQDAVFCDVEKACVLQLPALPTGPKRSLTFEERLQKRLPVVPTIVMPDWDENEETLLDDHDGNRNTPPQPDQTDKKPNDKFKWFPLLQKTLSDQSSDQDSHAMETTSEPASRGMSQAASQNEEDAWEASLCSHELLLHDQFSLVSRRVISLIANHKAAVSRTISRYQENASQLVEDLTQAHNDDFDMSVAKLDVDRAALANKFRGCEREVLADGNAMKHLALELDKTHVLHTVTLKYQLSGVSELMQMYG